MSKPADQNTFSAIDGFAVTPSDSTVFGTSMRAIHVGVSGDVKVRMISGNDLVIPSMAAGIPYPIEFDKVYTTGTTATGIVALR